MRIPGRGKKDFGNAAGGGGEGEKKKLNRPAWALGVEGEITIRGSVQEGTAYTYPGRILTRKKEDLGRGGQHGGYRGR